MVIEVLFSIRSPKFKVRLASPLIVFGPPSDDNAVPMQPSKASALLFDVYVLSGASAIVSAIVVQPPVAISPIKIIFRNMTSLFVAWPVVWHKLECSGRQF